MHLRHLEIHNLRCFTNFELDVGGESLTIVAPNGDGKSTLLTAVAWALGGTRAVSRDDLADPTEQLVIIATVGGLRQEDHGVFVEGALRFTGSPSVRIGIRGTWDQDADQLDVDWGFPDAGWRRAGRDVRAALPFLTLPADRDAGRLTDFAGARSILARLVDELGIGTAADAAAAAIATAGADLAASQGFVSLLEELKLRLATMIPNAGSYDVDPGERTAAELLRLLDLRLAHEGSPVPIRRQSSGLAQLTVAAVALSLLEESPDTLVLIDEPELSLHPHAQRAVTSSLRATGAQVLAATHSSSVLAEVDVRSVVSLRRNASDVTVARPGNIDATEAQRLRRFATPLTTEAFFARRVAFVEGITDYQAVRVVAAKLGRNLDAGGVAVVALDGAASLATFLEIMGPRGLDLAVCGICDADYESDWCSYLTAAGLPAASRQDLNALGFYVSDRDLEDELVTALGTTAAQMVFANEGATARFQSYAQQPGNQGMTLHDRIRGFAQSKKAYWTPRLAAAVTAAAVPSAIQDLLDHV
jgi:putative ATP-dependent endonuclease of OLD family